ncbi:methylmalonyl-CoA mutase family protein [Aeromicrobium sp. Leaf350]|uniref:methylmalonyl-CoA mutase family protein n=1 Tax=Aeromicrobium sp. Leaf350 TaxID=2876565 RepID=UPI001E51ECC6|nr:methylmalonyl-CoA mutase family protein [Aeromicrobium sp. Leaf350]
MSADTPAAPAEVTVPLAEGLTSTREAWEKATATVLRKSRRLADDAPDAEAWSTLTTTTLDGIEVTPLGTPELTADLPATGLPGQAPFTRGAEALRENRAWDVRAWFTDPDAQRTADDVMTDLENGVSSLWITLGEAGTPTDALARILEPVFVDLAPVVVQDAHDPLSAARALAAVIEDKAVQAHHGTNLGVDPIGTAVRTRLGSGTGQTDLDLAVEAARLALPLGIRAIVVDGTAVHDAGGSDVQELAYLLAAGATYLRVLTEAGLSVDDAAGLLEFRIAATDEQFPTMAKFRAARRTWARVAELAGVAEAQRGQRQHAVTSRPMMTTYDPYVNMLRTTVASFAAGVGGAASVTVLPFDEPLGLPEAFSRRIARNTSSLLISESHVAKVTDPGGGSHLVEQLTDDLARAAWAGFGELESAGGVLSSLDLVAERIDATRDARGLQIAKRAMPLTGVSEFPNLHEQLPERRPYPTEQVVFRYAHEFEEMRDDRAAATVFLATMGPVAAHTARATFAANLFAAGGIDTVTAGPTAGVDEVVAAYDGSPVVCLTGNDKAYAEWGSELVAALREAGARHVVVAGKVDVGADAQAFAGLDALAFLRTTREELV